MKQSRFTWKTSATCEGVTFWTVEASDSPWFADVNKWDATIWLSKDRWHGVHRFRFPVGATFQEIRELVETEWLFIEGDTQRRTQKAK